MSGLLRVTYDPEADAAYIYLTAQDLPAGRDSIVVDYEPDQEDHVRPDIVLDFRDGRLAGIEVVGARDGLHADLLELAEPPGT